MRKLLLLLSLVITCCHRAADVPTVEPHRSTFSSPTASASLNAESGALRFAVIGDWGAGTRDQRDIATEMCKIRGERPYGLVVTTGDNFYPRGTATEANYSSPEACLLSDQSLVWKPVWGNHDAPAPSTGEIFGIPRYYSFQQQGVTFIMLDSNQTASAEQRTWLETQLAKPLPGPKIVVFHHPPYTVGTVHQNDPGVQIEWVPLFEKYRVPLVLNGHNHDYEHSRVNGGHYVVSGGGGATLYKCARNEPWLIKCRSAHHFLLIEIEGSVIRVQAIGSAGELIDQFDVSAK